MSVHRFAALPAADPPPPRRLADRWLFASRAGRVLALLLALKVLQWSGVPVPDVFVVLANIILFGYFCWGTLRFGRVLGRLLFWRIRTRILVSYVFIGVLPLVLLLVMAGLTGILGLALFAAHNLTTELNRQVERLRAASQVVTTGLPADKAAAVREIDRRLVAVKDMHPQLAWALVRDGKPLVTHGTAPVVLPEWIPTEGFAGLVVDGADQFLRVATRDEQGFLLLQVPVDATLVAELEKATTIRFITAAGAHVTANNQGLRIDMSEDEREARRGPRNIDGMPFVALTDRRDWKDGETSSSGIMFTFQPRQFFARLSPGSLNVGDIIVQGLAVVAAVFLVTYLVAVLIGLLLARSVTKSVHALSIGTERLRRGDFQTPIPVYGRNQLGELAESFNLMARGVQQLLVEQAEKERLSEELRIARQIQMKLLPQGTVTLPGLRIAALCLPAAEVGGDYYDLLPLSPTRMGVLVADVSGKGTSAALYMAELKGLVLSLSRIYESPAQLLAEANRILAGTMDSRSFITMTYAVVDTEARTLRYARAGHNPLIHLEAATGATRVLAPAGLGLGIDRHGRFEEILEESVVPLAEGDVFLFFTDGISEAMNTSDELFGEHRLRDLIARSEAMGSEEIKSAILGEIEVFVGTAAQHDDMTMVILKVDGPREVEADRVRLLLDAAS